MPIPERSAILRRVLITTRRGKPLKSGMEAGTTHSHTASGRSLGGMKAQSSDTLPKVYASGVTGR